MKVRLNKRTLDEATYQGPGGCYLWDTELSAFGVRIYPTGRKSFFVSYWSRGRRRFYTLGQYGRMTVKQAREEALEVFLRVRRGEDPSADRRAVNQAPTMADLAERHIEEHAKIKNKARSAKRARQLWDRCVLPKLGKRKVADIRRADIDKLMTEMAATPAMANAGDGQQGAQPAVEVVESGRGVGLAARGYQPLSPHSALHGREPGTLPLGIGAATAWRSPGPSRGRILGSTSGRRCDPLADPHRLPIERDPPAALG